MPRYIFELVRSRWSSGSSACTAWASTPPYSQPRQVSPRHRARSRLRDPQNSRPPLAACFRKLLPPDYDLVFLDGPATCDAAPGVAALYPGPYRCWYDTPTTSKVQKAHAAVLAFARRAGPFDGVMGFSQGAALAASVLLHHELEGAPPPFAFAVFVCAPLPFSHALAHGIDTRAHFGSPAQRPVRPDCPDAVPAHLVADAAYLRGEERLAAAKAKASAAADAAGPVRAPAAKEEEEEGAHFYQMFHASVDRVRIQVPTVHVVGARDKWRLHSLDVLQLCARDLAVSFEHGGGHEIPRDTAEDMCDLIEGLVAVAMAGA